MPHDHDPQPTRKTQLTQPKKGEPIEIPVPSEDDFEKLVSRAVNRAPGQTELNERVVQELACFPDDTYPQRQVRMLYQMQRSRDLGKDSEHPGATALESAERVFALVREDHPDFEPKFDRATLRQLDAAGSSDD